MKDLSKSEIWLVTGSQHLYGEEVLTSVASHSRELAAGLDKSEFVPVQVVFKSVVTTAGQITEVCQQANSAHSCIGVVVWMHTFSPAKMWIRGLQILNKPLAHLHTQYHTEIPWESIDMDFMNENQSAHGDREFGFITSRLRIPRKVVVGHWKQPSAQQQLGTWARVAAGWAALQNTRVARIGDNMRQVAVTEGDKVAAQARFGFEVNGYGLGDVVKHVKDINQSQVTQLVEEYHQRYHMPSDSRHQESVKEAARIELGLRSFLEAGEFQAFTDTFENLYGLKQLPGIAVQRLMADGFGFGAEGDWKTAALLRAIKVMDQGLPGGSSFMEDYTYDFNPQRPLVLGAHMLEICPSIARGKPSVEVHPLGIGGKEDPARLVFDSDAGPAINVSLIDLGHRFRLVANEVEVKQPSHELPRLPVARVLWAPQPGLEVAAHCWILAGGAHHTVFSKAITMEFLEDFAEIAGVELVIIDKDTRTRDLKQQLRWNEAYYQLAERG